MVIIRKICEILTITLIVVIGFAPLDASAQSDKKASCNADSMQAVISKGYQAAHRSDWRVVLSVALALNIGSGICTEKEQAITSALYGDFFGAIGFRHLSARKHANELLTDGRDGARRAVDQGLMPELSRKMLRRFDALAAHPMDVPG